MTMQSLYRVIDLTDHRGHLAGFILARLGAEVIAVEPPATTAGWPWWLRTTTHGPHSPG